MVSHVILVLALTQNFGDRKVPDVANEPQQVTVCKILNNLRTYDGKVVAVQVANLNLKGRKCQDPTAADDPRLMKPGEPPVNEIDVVSFSFATMAGPLGKVLHDYDRWLGQGYDVSMRIVGRIEVRPAGQPFGFGHLGAYQAQIIITRIEEMKRSAKKGPKRKTIHIE